jgi:single-strand DNA-binding protein
MQINELTVVGNLTKDPELKYLNSGAAVVNLYIGINRKWKAKGSEELKQETVFINVVVWGKEAERCGQTLTKGQEILVRGRLTQRSWEDKTTQKKITITEIKADNVMPTPKRESSEEQGGGEEDGR